MSCINDLAKCDAAYFALKQQLNDAEYKLAAAQAREKVLRSHLETLACLGNGCHPGNSTGNQIAIDALATPADDTALRAALKAERERIADLFEGQYTDTCPQTNISRAIRALEDN